MPNTISLRFTRGINILQVLAGYFLSKITKKVFVFGKPISVSVEPTTACNLGCPECPSGLKSFTRPTGNLSIANYKNWLQELRKSTSFLTFYFQGEPFLHKDIVEMVALTEAAGIACTISTNGHFLSEKTCDAILEAGLSKLIISVDGTEQQTYEAYRKQGKLDKVIEGIRNMVAAKKKLGKKSHTKIIIQFLAVRANEHQIEEIKGWQTKYGVDAISIKTAQLYDYENGNVLMPKQEQYSRYKLGGDGKYHLKNALENHCWRLWSSAVITWDGKVVPCCFDKDAKYSMGSMGEISFTDIWNSEAYNTFRRNVLDKRSSIDICTNCSEGTKVWA